MTKKVPSLKVVNEVWHYYHGAMEDGALCGYVPNDKTPRPHELEEGDSVCLKCVKQMTYMVAKNE